jgi:hypothetical protein
MVQENVSRLLPSAGPVGLSPSRPWGKNGLWAGLSFKYGLPLNTGFIEDRDWLARGADYLTNYSQHNAFSSGSPLDIFSGTGTFMTEFSAGYSWAFVSSFWIRAGVELSYLRFSWMSQDGYTQYGIADAVYGSKSWDTGPIIPHSGPAITYTQNWLMAAPELEAGLKLTELFSVSASISLSPLIYGFCRDDHLAAAKRNTYLDYLSAGISLKEKLELRFKPNQRFVLSLSAALMDTSGSRGDDYMSKNGSSYIRLHGKAGGGYRFLDVSLSGAYVL